MSKNLLLIACVTLLTIACQSNDTQQMEQQVAISLTIAEFDANPKEYVDKVITISGTVDHVCKHGGKKMFIMGENPDERLKINTTDKVGPFLLELEGSDVEVKGVIEVMKIDEAYLNEWEAEVRAEHGEANIGETSIVEGEAGGAGCAEETGKEEKLDNLTEALSQVNSLREELVNSGADYLGFYSLKCQSFEEINK